MVFSTSIAYVFIAVVVLLAGASVVAWGRSRPTLAVLLLMGAAFGLRLLMAGLDPYLHDWDERFHALVARNMLVHPFEPMLRAATWYPYEYQAWCCNHIWLHKQPLFLWQMALSLKLFGISELALRLPSALLSSLVLWPVYRLGYLAFSDRLVGYLGALLAAFAHYQVEQVAGAIGMDHNDIAFLVYVTASIWAYYEYRSSPRPTRWLVLVGVLAGAAIMCKWLTGLLVYVAWGLDLLLRPEVRRQLLPELGRLVASVAVAVVLMLPWQLYTAWRFPQESAFERAYNARHFTEALEGHGFPWSYHFELLPAHYGWMRWLMLLGIGLALRRHWRAAVPLLAVVASIYLFFSVAVTKMYSYTYVASLLLLLLAALPLAAVARWLGQPGRYVLGRQVLVGLGLLAVLLADLRPWGIVAFHFKEGSYDIMTGPANHPIRAANAAIYRQLAQAVPPGTMVFNAADGEDLEAMFYSGLDVYTGLPAEADVRAMKAQGIRLAVYPARAGQALPAYLQTPEVVQLWGELR